MNLRHRRVGVGCLPAAEAETDAWRRAYLGHGDQLGALQAEARAHDLGRARRRGGVAALLDRVRTPRARLP